MAGELVRKPGAVTRARRSAAESPAWVVVLEERFDGLHDQFEQLSADFRDERDRAEKHRQQILDGLSVLERTVAVLNNTVASLHGRVEKVEPLADDYRERRAEGRGASKLRARLVHIGLVLLGIAATLGAAVIGAHVQHLPLPLH